MKEEDLIHGRYYWHNTPSYPEGPYIRRKGYYHIYPLNKYYLEGCQGWTGTVAPINIREATHEEMEWLEACVSAKGFVPQRLVNYSIY